MNDQSYPYKIQKGVPFPGKGRGRPKNAHYPFARLEPGDSFFVPSDDPVWSHNRGLIRALFLARRETGWDLQWTKEEGGFRIFRLEDEAPTKEEGEQP